jgi:CDP-diacylglycerol--glycerol-3-phosphate 3-phosphatidyltransferase
MFSGGRPISFPDWLAIARIVAVPVIMGLTRLYLHPTYPLAGQALYLAALLFAAAAITDFLDGYLARRWKQESVTGAFLDTTADKLLVSGSLLALTAIDRVSIWAALIIIMREFLVMGLRGVVAVGGGMMKPTTWGKVKAWAQYLAIFLAFLRLPERWGPLYLDQWVMWIAVIVTIGSGWQYFVGFWEQARKTRSSTTA